MVPPSLPLTWRLCAVHLVIAGSVVSAADPAPAVHKGIDLTLVVADGMKTSKDQPMITMWVEDNTGKFQGTLWRFGRVLKYYKTMTVWNGFSSKAEKPADLDVLTGATIVFASQTCLRIPQTWHGVDLLKGNMVLRIESNKDHGKHFSSFSIPLKASSLSKYFPDKDKGYVASVSITATPAGVAVADIPTVVPVPAVIAAALLAKAGR